MPYCSPNNVRTLITTPLSDTEIMALIEESDAEIEHKLGPQDASSKLVSRLSALITSRIIRTTYPGSVSVGEFQEDESGPLLEWAKEIDRIYRFLSKPATAVSSYNAIDEETRFKEVV